MDILFCVLQKYPNPLKEGGGQGVNGKEGDSIGFNKSFPFRVSLSVKVTYRNGCLQLISRNARINPISSPNLGWAQCILMSMIMEFTSS